MEYKNLILIAGAARSFTTLTAGILHHAGAWGMKDNFKEDSTRDGANFTYENVDLVGNFIDASKDFRKNQFADSPQIIGRCLRSVAQNIFDQHGLPQDRVSFIKHPTLVSLDGRITWMDFFHAFPEAKWIIVRRPEEEIRKSHIRHYGKIRFDTPNVLSQLDVMAPYFNSLGVPCFKISPGNELDDPTYALFKQMVAWAGLEWNNSIEAFIDPEKRHFTTAPAEKPQDTGQVHQLRRNPTPP